MIFVTVEKKDLKQTICTKILLRDEKALLILQCTDIERKANILLLDLEDKILFLPCFCCFVFCFVCFIFYNTEVAVKLTTKHTSYPQ